MHSLTFDQGKMYIFVFSIDYKFTVKKKKIKKTLYVINAYMFQVYLMKIS